MKKLLTCLAIASTVVAAQADDLTWAANILGGDGTTWSSVDNWFNLTAGAPATAIPGVGDNAIMKDDVFGNPILTMPEVSANVGTVAGVLVGQTTSGSLTVNAGGSLSTSGNLLIAVDPGVSGSVVNNGTLSANLTYLHAGIATFQNNGILNTADLIPGHLAGSDTTLSNAGDINVAGVMYTTIAGNSVINMNSGVVTVGNTLFLTHAGGGTGAFNMNGGTVNVGTFDLLQEGGTGHLQLDGGTITAAVMGLNGNANNTIDITEGVLIAVGDHSGGMDWMASIGVITAYGGAGTVIADYDIGLNETTLHAVIPEPATLSLVALLGGGMLWVRKRFMV